MNATYHLRERRTQPIDEAAFAAAVAEILGPPGLVRYPPPSPALFPLVPPRRRPRWGRLGASGLLLGAGLLFWHPFVPVAAPVPPAVAPIPVAQIEPPTAAATIAPTDTPAPPTRVPT